MVVTHRPWNQIALTGTPGTGKSSVAALLPRRWTVCEVGELAIASGAGRRIRGGVEIDLPRLRHALSAQKPPSAPRVLVGHLAHLLPVDAAVVLRCHPLELERRLARAHRGSWAERRQNVAAEATDIILVEALAQGVTVWEVDTTGRPPLQVAARVIFRLRAKGPPRYGDIDWLGDPTVTEHLLDACP